MLGVNLAKHDVRFVEDDWQSPSLGASGLGWEVWIDGMEITQFTYFQQVGGIDLRPITVEITYGLERISMYLQKVSSVFDMSWVGNITYGDVHRIGEREWSQFNFEKADVEVLKKMFEMCEGECERMISFMLVLPAYDQVLKCSHIFNLLEARRAFSVTERTFYINRVRSLSKKVASMYIKQREELGFPLCQKT
jgi:glycyl-tRNA synthetase alpha chain